jgi:RimJ/RimL family protein N-acetyltransferase
MNIIYETDRFYVVPFQDVDLSKSNYSQWFHDQEVTRYNSHGLFPYTERAMQEFLKGIDINSSVVWAIISKWRDEHAKWQYYCEVCGEHDEIEGLPTGRFPQCSCGGKMFQRPAEPNSYQHIGNLSLQQIDWINRSAEMAIVIGEKDYWGKGFATEALLLLYYHAFTKLNLNRIWSGTTENNSGMIRVFARIGMALEGEFREAVYLNGEYRDVYAYGILKEAWENDEKVKQKCQAILSQCGSSPSGQQ